MRGKNAGYFLGKTAPPLLVVIVLSGLLLTGGCLDAVPGANVTPGASAPGPAGEEDYPIGNRTDTAREYDAALDPSFFRDHSPLVFLKDLRTYPGRPVLVLEVPADWITREDAAALMQMIGSEEPAAPVVSALSSYFPFNQTSTVGNEAMFLLEGYRTGRYPPALCSLHYFKPDRTAMRAWWDAYGRKGILEENTAISLLKSRDPALRSYPSDEWPPGSIQTERAPGGWYVAFIREGSGVPIISAQCYFVGDDREIRLVGRVNRSMMILPDEFSAQRCGC